jgi:hypothetical protein
MEAEMKNLVLLAVLFVVSSALLKGQGVYHSSATSATEMELVSLTSARIEAINTRNRTKLEELMAPDFALQGWDGSWRVERAKWLENLLTHIDIAEYRHSQIVAHVYGDVAAITSRWYWRGNRGTASEKKPFEEHGYVVDMWRRNSGRWQVVSRISVVLNGKEDGGS